jgi:hypothetical protein
MSTDAVQPSLLQLAFNGEYISGLLSKKQKGSGAGFCHEPSVITPKPASHDHFKTGQAWQLRTFWF